MATHPYRDVIVAGVYNTEQARRLPGRTVADLCTEAVLGACADAGIDPSEIDGVVGMQSGELVYELGLGPALRISSSLGIPAILHAAQSIAARQASVVVVTAAGAGLLSDDGSAAVWTRPPNELTAPYGLFTAAEMALVATRHMIEYGTTVEQLALVAATIRNNGHANPEAVYHGRGPFTPADIRASRPVAEPFHLLDCATTSEGGTALVLTAADRAEALAQPPAYIHGGASDAHGPAYAQAPSFDRTGPRATSSTGERRYPAGYVGRRAAEICFAQSGLNVDDVDVCEFYDPFSFEIIRQFEAYGFCADGEGGPFVESGVIGPGGRFPITTDGGTMAFAHAGISAQMLQRVVRGVQQVRGECQTMQVPGAEIAMCSNGGSGAMFTDVMLVGSTRP